MTFILVHNYLLDGKVLTALIQITIGLMYSFIFSTPMIYVQLVFSSRGPAIRKPRVETETS